MSHVTYRVQAGRYIQTAAWDPRKTCKFGSMTQSDALEKQEQYAKRIGDDKQRF
jgi:hypothetical protein